MTTPTIQEIIGDVAGATKAAWGLSDNLGNSMDTLKVIQDPAAAPGKGYLAVYCPDSAGTVKLATSTDLIHWTYVTDVDYQATQPYIYHLTDGGFIVADEFNSGAGGHVRLFYYPNRASLFLGFNGPDVTPQPITLPRTLSRCNEGTPNIYSVTLNPDILHSTIDVGHHFHSGTPKGSTNTSPCTVDRQARGTLTNWSRWTTAAQNNVNAGVIAAAQNVGADIGGNIGARDNFEYAGAWYNLIEGQYTQGDFGTWNAYLWHWLDSTCEEIEFTGPDGPILSLGNPRVTVLTAPSGNPAVWVSFYCFDPGNNPSNGPLAYYREYTP